MNFILTLRTNEVVFNLELFTREGDQWRLKYFTVVTVAEIIDKRLFTVPFCYWPGKHSPKSRNANLSSTCMNFQTVLFHRTGASRSKIKFLGQVLGLEKYLSLISVFQNRPLDKIEMEYYRNVLKNKKIIQSFDQTLYVIWCLVLHRYGCCYSAIDKHVHIQIRKCGVTVVMTASLRICIILDYPLFPSYSIRCL